ncbi:hypothetical protein COV19_03460 [Candidatus Woesearchaeota archaeon CG10_big_fil_rev_8_21_14_0_10_44_13]|nr:MAG: hypothetical protein COV19_03460 [Candidatus Woesearchaeota archaeon CG10_big_fil_rev_8_21_14_0_10_44_13]
MKIANIVRFIGIASLIAAILTLVFRQYSNVFYLFIIVSIAMCVAAIHVDDDIAAIKERIRKKVKK